MPIHLKVSSSGVVTLLSSSASLLNILGARTSAQFFSSKHIAHRYWLWPFGWPWKWDSGFWRTYCIVVRSICCMVKHTETSRINCPSAYCSSIASYSCFALHSYVCALEYRQRCVNSYLTMLYCLQDLFSRCVVVIWLHSTHTLVTYLQCFIHELLLYHRCGCCPLLLLHNLWHVDYIHQSYIFSRTWRIIFLEHCYIIPFDNMCPSLRASHYCLCQFSSPCSLYYCMALAFCLGPYFERHIVLCFTNAPAPTCTV